MHYTPPIARTYVKRIRNAAKRQYASDYLTYLMGRGPEPLAKCSTLAAQAVRMNLDSIMAECHVTN
jgi:hypothetical protein